MQHPSSQVVARLAASPRLTGLLCGGLLLLLAGLTTAQAAETERGDSAVPLTEVSVADSIAVEEVTSDEAIAARLRAILTATGWFAPVQVRVDSGVVFLSGEAQEQQQIACIYLCG